MEGRLQPTCSMRVVHISQRGPSPPIVDHFQVEALVVRLADLTLRMAIGLTS